jgi:hypothetical protein
MAADMGIEHRLDWMETRAELGELVTRFGKAIDERDVRGLAALFIAEGRIRSRDGMLDADGTAGIIATYRKLFDGLGPSYHWHHGHLLFRDKGNPDQVRGQLMAHSETFRKGEQYLAALRYDDVYRRVAGEWKFEERVLSFLYFCSMDDYRDILGREKRVLVHGDQRSADWPETFETWRNYNDAQSQE